MVSPFVDPLVYVQRTADRSFRRWRVRLEEQVGAGLALSATWRRRLASLLRKIRRFQPRPGEVVTEPIRS